MQLKSSSGMESKEKKRNLVFFSISSEVARWSRSAKNDAIKTNHVLLLIRVHPSMKVGYVFFFFFFFEIKRKCCIYFLYFFYFRRNKSAGSTVKGGGGSEAHVYHYSDVSLTAVDMLVEHTLTTVKDRVSMCVLFLLLSWKAFNPVFNLLMCRPKGIRSTWSCEHFRKEDPSRWMTWSSSEASGERVSVLMWGCADHSSSALCGAGLAAWGKSLFCYWLKSFPPLLTLWHCQLPTRRLQIVSRPGNLVVNVI